MYITVTQAQDVAALPRKGHIFSRRTVPDATRQSTPLAKVLHLAIRLNHGRAVQEGVRVRGYARAQSLPLANVRGVLARLDRIVRSAICNARRDSLVIAELGMTKGEVHLRLRYARSLACTTNDLTGLNWIDEFWSFDAKATAVPH